MKNESHTRPRFALASSAFLLLLFLTIYPLRLDSTIGLLVDDGWYVLLGKALATTGSYTMINAPTPGIHPATPPVFPALLALIWLLWGEFPANLWLFKAVSIAAMFGVGVVAFHYFWRYRKLPFYLASGIAAATVFYPALVFMATATVMAECLFTLAQLAAIVAVERCLREDRQQASWREAALAGALVSLAFLIRSAGVGLLAASVLYLLKERRFRQALVLGVVIALTSGTWIIYARAKTPTPEQRVEQAGSILVPYTEQFWHRMAGNISAGTITAGELPARVWKNLAEITRHDMGAVPLYIIYRSLEPGRQVYLNRPAIWLSLLLAALALLGWAGACWERMTMAEIAVPLSLAVSVLWGWEQFRFLLPLIPFFIFYQLMGVRAVYQMLARFAPSLQPAAIWTRLALLAWAMTALNVYSNFQFIAGRQAPGSGNVMRLDEIFAENMVLIGEVRARLPQEAVLATNYPALIHLFTGHKTVAIGDQALSWDMWQRLGVRYLVYTAANRLPPPEPAESRYQTIYRQPGRLGMRIVDLGPPSSRPRWGE